MRQFPGFFDSPLPKTSVQQVTIELHRKVVFHILAPHVGAGGPSYGGVHLIPSTEESSMYPAQEMVGFCQNFLNGTSACGMEPLQVAIWILSLSPPMYCPVLGLIAGSLNF